MGKPPRIVLRRVLDRGNLALAEIVQLLRLGRVVAVAIDDHDASLGSPDGSADVREAHLRRKQSEGK